MDFHAVMKNGNASVFHFLAVLEFCSGEINIIGLPSKRREAHVHIRRFNAVNAAALVVFSSKPKRVEHLHLITGLQITTAIAAPLPSGLGLKRQFKFDVQAVTLKLFYAIRALLQQTILRDFARLELFCIGAIEKHDGTLGRLATKGGAFAVHGFQLARIRANRSQVQLAAIDTHGPTIGLGEISPGGAGSTVDLDFLALVPSGTGQSAFVNHRTKFTITQRDDLHAGAFAGILALDLIIRPSLVGIENRTALVRRKREMGSKKGK